MEPQISVPEKFLLFSLGYVFEVNGYCRRDVAEVILEQWPVLSLNMKKSIQECIFDAFKAGAIPPSAAVFWTALYQKITEVNYDDETDI